MKNPSAFFWRLACVLFLAFNIYAEHSGLFLVRPPLKFGLALCFCALLTLALRPFESRRRKKQWLWLLFVYYLWVLANMLFFDAAFGRAGGGLGGVNLVPFYTIGNYLRAYRLGNIGPQPMLMNLAGNLAAFAPMAVFLPAFMRRQRNVFVFLLTIVGLVAAAEGIQYLTGTGSCDIDDLILNTAGAAGLWLLLLPWRLLRKEENA